MRMVLRAALGALSLSLFFGPSMAFAAHPHILFSASDVPTLQQKAQGAGSALATPFLNGAQGMLNQSMPSTGTYGDPREAADILVVMSMAAVLTGDSQHINVAKNYLDTYLSWSDWQFGGGIDLYQTHFVYDVALTYDWLYSSLSSSERTSVINRLTTECNLIQGASQGNSAGWWSIEYTQNHNWVNNASLGMCALALEGDVPAATTNGWLQTVETDLTSVSEMMDQISDGTWHEGIGYQSYGLNRLLPFLEALRQIKGIDLTNVAMMKQASHWRAANMLPGSARTYLVDSGDTWGWDGEGTLFEHIYFAHRFGDSIAAGVAQAWQNAGSLNTYVPDIDPEVFAFLLYDPSVTPANMADMPLDQRFDDFQAAIFRSNNTSSSALVLGLKTGPYGGEAVQNRLINNISPVGNLNIGHDHSDDNGLYLYGNGQPLLPEAAGYNAGVGNGHPPAQLSEYHNTLLVDGAGQLGEDRTTDDENAESWATTRTGGIPRGASTDDYAFALGSGPHLYDSSLGLSRFDRQVLFVNRQYVVVRDAIDSSHSHTYSQVWHFLDGASSSSGWIQGVAKSSQLLGVGVVSPSNYSFSTSNLSPDNVSHLDPDGVIVEARVSTPSATTNARMLSVLWPSSTSTWSSKPQLQPLSSTAGAGVVVTNGTKVDEVLFHDNVTDSSTEGDLTLTGLGAVVSTSSGSLSHFAILEATHLARSGTDLLLLPASASIEASFSSNVLSITGEGVNVFKAYAPNATQVLVNGVSVPFQLDGNNVVVPPYGQMPVDSSTLVSSDHPIWHNQQVGLSGPWQSGTNGWTTPTTTSSTTSATVSSSATSTSSSSSSTTTGTSSTATSTTSTTSSGVTTGTTGGGTTGHTTGHSSSSGTSSHSSGTTGGSTSTNTTSSSSGATTGATTGTSHSSSSTGGTGATGGAGGGTSGIILTTGATGTTSSGSHGSSGSNGSHGSTTGTPGRAHGGFGCSSSGVAPSGLSLLGLLVLMRRRQRKSVTLGA